MQRHIVITKKEEVEGVLKEALITEDRLLIECIIDSDDKVWPMVAPGAANFRSSVLLIEG